MVFLIDFKAQSSFDGFSAKLTDLNRVSLRNAPSTLIESSSKTILFFDVAFLSRQMIKIHDQLVGVFVVSSFGIEQLLFLR